MGEVLDEELRIESVEGFRVIDASVFLSRFGVLLPGHESDCHVTLALFTATHLYILFVASLNTTSVQSSTSSFATVH